MRRPDGPPHDLRRLIEVLDRLRVAGMSDADARALPVQIDAVTLESAGMTTWMTDAGPFDVLVGLEAPDGHLLLYEDLVERAVVFQGDGFAIRTAAISDVINAKERADRPKDRATLPELHEIERQQHGQPTP